VGVIDTNKLVVYKKGGVCMSDLSTVQRKGLSGVISSVIGLVGVYIITHFLGYVFAGSALLTKHAFDRPEAYLGLPVIIAIVIAFTGSTFTSIRALPETSPDKMRARQSWLHAIASLIMFLSAEMFFGLLIGLLQSNFNAPSTSIASNMFLTAATLIGGAGILIIITVLSIMMIHISNFFTYIMNTTID
jgi:hypothetical protein